LDLTGRKAAAERQLTLPVVPAERGLRQSPKGLLWLLAIFGHLAATIRPSIPRAACRARKRRKSFPLVVSKRIPSIRSEL
jgi:hypothetical protein